MHALKDHPDLTYVMGMQEASWWRWPTAIARLAAGSSPATCTSRRASATPWARCSTRKFTGTPMILTAGQQEQGHGLTEPLLYDPLVPIAEPLVKWAVEVTRLEDLPRIVRRAAKVATDAADRPGVHLAAGRHPQCRGRHRARRVDPRRYARRGRPTRRSTALAKRLLKAERPVIIVGDEIVKSDALQEAAAFAETLGCPVYQQSGALRRAFPVRARLLHGRAVARRRSRCASVLSQVRSADRARRRSRAHVGVERGRAAAGRHAHRPDRPGRLGHGQELRRRDGAAGRRARDAARAGAGAQGRRRRRLEAAPGKVSPS